MFDLLPTEMQIRFRKSLLKAKEILFKNKFIEVGIISTLNNEIELQMTIIFTNISDNSLTIDEVEF